MIGQLNLFVFLIYLLSTDKYKRHSRATFCEYNLARSVRIILLVATLDEQVSKTFSLKRKNQIVVKNVVQECGKGLAKPR